MWYQPPQNGSLSGLYSFHPNFQLAQLAYSNGVTGTFTQGTKGMNRPTKLNYKKGGTSLFNTGSYKYDGAGNIYEIGSDRYTYECGCGKKPLLYKRSCPPRC